LISKTGNRLFYGWVIVGASLITICTLFGIRFSSFGIFFKSLQAEFEAGRAITSSIFSANMVFAAIFGIVTGWALDRYGPRLVVALIGLFTGMSLIITSYTTSIWQLFLSYSLLLSMGTAGTVVVLVSVVSRWFDKKRGIAIGIATSGTGLGSLILAPLAAYLISNYGWRTSYLVLGLAAGIIVFSLAMLLRRQPGEIGEQPDGIPSGYTRGESKEAEEDSQLAGHTLKQAIMTRSFWLILGIWAFFAICLSLIITHIVPHATDLGISTMEAATIISLIGIVQIIARLSAGRISDVVGRKLPGVICSFIGAAALIWLFWASELWMFYLFAVIFGIAYGGLGVVQLALVSDIFGRRHLGTIMGVLEVGFSSGSGIGAFIGGLIFDITGSYSIAFAIGAVTILLISLLIALTRRETAGLS